MGIARLRGGPTIDRLEVRAHVMGNGSHRGDTGRVMRPASLTSEFSSSDTTCLVGNEATDRQRDGGTTNLQINHAGWPAIHT